MPKISVIVPNYNHALYLPQRIESILQQTCQDFELILLDDCSTDNSREIIEQYGNHPKVSHVIFNEKNSSSPFAQWNRGIEMAKGEYVWIAESDDWADVDFLQVLTEQMDRHPNVVLAYTLARYMNQKGTSELWSLEETGSITSFEGIQFIRNYLLFANVVYNVSMTLFRRSAFLQINHTLYNRMKLCGDWFFYTLLCEQGDVLRIAKAYTNYRVHPENSSQRAEYEGRSFLEGLNILDYICKRIKTNPLNYSAVWAKQWVKYEKKYQFSADINKQIKQRIFKTHRLIFCYYYLYRLHYQRKKAYGNF